MLRACQRSTRLAARWPLCHRFASTSSSHDKEEEPTAAVTPAGWFSNSAAVAPAGFDNRWALMVPAFATHLCIGTGWAWSVVSNTIVREQGFVCSAAGDWGLTAATMPMPILFATFGLTSAAVGNWQNRVGPRTSIALAGAFYGGGVIACGAGIGLHDSLILNFGSALAGCGVGLAYTPPIQALMGWFPDKKGLAMGTLVAGFGSGALLMVPSFNWLCTKFATLPTYVGATDAITTTTREGVLYALEGADNWIEVVQATSTDLAQLSYPQLAEGLYLVGSGSTGAAEAVVVTGAVYWAVMTGCAFGIKTPRAGWLPEGYTPSDSSNEPSLTVEQVMRTPQFYLLGITFTCLTTGTYGLFSVAKGMTAEVFAGAFPLTVTAGWTSAYLMLLSVANLSGRFGMATLSDRVGCRNTFNLIIAGSLPVYLACPVLVQQCSAAASEVPLYMFVGGTFGAVFLSCGVISTTPAYEASLFGSRNVGAVHGRMLLFNSLAAVAGPNLFIHLRSLSENSAVQELLRTADPVRFQERFSVPIGECQQLIDAKTVTISKLLSLAPAGTVDPTPFIYDSTMYTMAGLVAVAALSHNLIKPIDSSFFANAESDPCKTLVGKKIHK